MIRPIASRTATRWGGARWSHTQSGGTSFWPCDMSFSLHYGYLQVYRKEGAEGFQGEGAGPEGQGRCAQVGSFNGDGAFYTAF